MMFLTALLAARAGAAPPAESPEAPPPKPRVALAFTGNDQVGSGALESALKGFVEDLAGEALDEGVLEDAAYEVERYYRSQGYLTARARARWDRTETGTVLRFSVDEGPRSLLLSLSFEGNQHFDGGELARCFQWMHGGFLRLGSAVFTREAMESGLGCVTARYDLDGFVFAKAEAVTSRDAAGWVRVHVVVEEGVRVSMEDPPELSFEGDHVFGEKELREALALDLPCFYSPRLPSRLKGRLLDFYGNRGYRFAEIKVRPRIDAASARARLSFHVKEGTLAHIGGVSVEGNKKTADWVIRDRVKLEVGDLYNQDRVRGTYRSLLRSGLFSTVNIETSPMGEARDRLQMKINVEEKPRYSTAFLVGFGSYELLRGKVEVEDRNLFGSGHRITLSARGSMKGAGTELRYLNPFVFNDRLSHGVRGYFSLRQNPSFLEREYGGDTGLAYRFTDKLQGELLYRLKQSRASRTPWQIPDDLLQTVLLSGFTIAATLDDRDSVVNPDQGSSHRLGLEYWGSWLGSDLDFLKGSGATSWVLPVWGKLRFVPSLRFGAIGRLAGTDVIPIQERFFLGGQSTIRSFKQDEAGPSIDGEPIGGEAFLLYNLELRFPLLLLKDLHGTVFGDIGSLTEKVEDFGGGRYLFGVGAGLRYNTPFGPVRLDVGFNPDRAPGEDLFVIQVGLGYPF